MMPVSLSLTLKAVGLEEHHLDQYLLSSLSNRAPSRTCADFTTSQQTNTRFLADNSRLGRRRMFCCGAFGAAVRAGSDSSCLVGMVAVCNKQLSSVERYSIASRDLKSLKDTVFDAHRPHGICLSQCYPPCQLCAWSTRPGMT